MKIALISDKSYVITGKPAYFSTSDLVEKSDWPSLSTVSKEELVHQVADWLTTDEQAKQCPLVMVKVDLNSTDHTSTFTDYTLTTLVGNQTTVVFFFQRNTCSNPFQMDSDESIQRPANFVGIFDYHAISVPDPAFKSYYKLCTEGNPFLPPETKNILKTSFIEPPKPMLVPKGPPPTAPPSAVPEEEHKAGDPPMPSTTEQPVTSNSNTITDPLAGIDQISLTGNSGSASVEQTQQEVQATQNATSENQVPDKGNEDQDEDDSHAE